MNVSDVWTWEDLGSLPGWSELAAHCDASPFSWPSYCLPWWYEVGWGKLLSVAVEESGLLVGLALVHGRVREFGRPTFRFVADGEGTYHQLLVADDRADVTALIWERLLASGREIELTSVPAALAHEYVASQPALALVAPDAPGFVDMAIKTGADRSTFEPGNVRTVTEPAQFIERLSVASEAARWNAGEPGTPAAAFFASMVDESMRRDRLTLHVEDGDVGAANGLLVLHGSRTSVVLRHAGHDLTTEELPLVQAAKAEAGERGSHRLLWPDAVGLRGDPFPLAGIGRVQLAGGRLRAFPRMARSVLRTFRGAEPA